jgi:hypothetical protein
LWYRGCGSDSHGRMGLAAAFAASFSNERLHHTLTGHALGADVACAD